MNNFIFALLIGSLWFYSSHLQHRIETMEQRTAWMCRLPVAGPNHVGQLVLVPGDYGQVDGQVKLEGCP